MTINEASISPTGPKPGEPDGRCRFPGCSRPTERKDGPGRPSLYCSDPDHNRIAAWRTRRDSPDGPNLPHSIHAGHPVTKASLRASELFDRASEAGTQQIQLLEQLLTELKTITDHDAAQVEIEAVRATAEQRVVEAKAEAAKAQDQTRILESELREATEVADEAAKAYEDSEAQRQQLVGSFESQIAELNETIQKQAVDAASQENQLSLHAKELTRKDELIAEQEQAITLANSQRSQADTRANQLDQRLEQLRQDLAEATADKAHNTERIRQLETELERSRSSYESAIESAQKYQEVALAGQSEAAALSAKLEASSAHSAQRLSDQQAAHQQRIEDQRETYESRLEELRQQIATLSSPTQHQGQQEDDIT